MNSEKMIVPKYYLLVFHVGLIGLFLSWFLRPVVAMEERFVALLVFWGVHMIFVFSIKSNWKKVFTVAVSDIKNDGSESSQFVIFLTWVIHLGFILSIGLIN